MTDEIEAHLLGLLGGRSAVELQRGELAGRFGCAPSQINYVLVTRFTSARGFLVESRRGGGGYIRLVRLSPEAWQDVAVVGQAVDQATAEQHLRRLREAGRLSAREESMLRAVIAREVLALPLPLRDQIRASVLRAALGGLDREPDLSSEDAGGGEAQGAPAGREAGDHAADGCAGGR
jgi:transcriptional regulator CtsR